MVSYQRRLIILSKDTLLRKYTWIDLNLSRGRVRLIRLEIGLGHIHTAVSSPTKPGGRKQLTTSNQNDSCVDGVSWSKVGSGTQLMCVFILPCVS